MIEGDRHLLIAHLREGKFVSAGIMLSRMDHDTAFRIMSGFSDDTLKKIVLRSHSDAMEHAHRLEQATYLKVAGTTILRERGAYGGLTESIAKESQEDLEKIKLELAGTGIMRES